MDIEISYRSCKNSLEAFKKVKEIITPETVSEKFGIDVNIDYYEEALVVTAKGGGFSVDFTFSDSMLMGKLTLSFLLKPLRSKIVKSLTEQLQTIL